MEVEREAQHEKLVSICDLVFARECPKAIINPDDARFSNVIVTKISEL